MSEPAPLSEEARLIAEVARLKREIHFKNEALHEKNLALDALHYVWCDGGCPDGVHRYTDETFTEEVVLQAEYQALRLRRKYEGMRWQIENWPTLPTTQSEWHREHVERLKLRIGYMQKGGKVRTGLVGEVARLRGLLRKWNEHLPGCAKWIHEAEPVGTLFVCSGEDTLRDDIACTCGWADIERELAGEEADGGN